MNIGVVRETFHGERRVALTPHVLGMLGKAGHSVTIEAGSGIEAGFPDADYQARQAVVVRDRAEVFRAADVIGQIRTIGANPKLGQSDLLTMRPGQVVIGLADPLGSAVPLQAAAERGVRLLALELVPRITRAQSMDVLSSQATIAGYKAALMAAMLLGKMCPMMMTAAGTIAAARALVIGAGVAGLQAIATIRRNGAVVTGYDVRPAVKEQVESLGARFLEIELRGSQDAGGYARAMDEDFYRRQREMMAKAVAESDIVITTAAVPGKRSPVLVTSEMVRGMRPGAVIVDLAAERGGNCELTRADETVVEHGVTIAGPTNLPSTVPHDASQLFARNLAEFIRHLTKDGSIVIDSSDEITRGTLICDNGRIVNARVRATHGLPAEETANA